ncbi:hypothetical protein ES703_110228 [subsurface metagenome]
MRLNIKPDPDFTNIIKVLKRQEPSRTVFFELFADSKAEFTILEMLGELKTEEKAILEKEDFFYWNPDYIKTHIRYQYLLGYDYINVEALGFNFVDLVHKSTAETKEGKRAYLQSTDYEISSYSDFEAFSWLNMKAIDYSPFENAKKIMPEGMKIIGRFSGILENVMWLLGAENINYLLYDEPRLVDDTFEAVASRIINYFDNIASFDHVGAIIMGEDISNSSS